MRPLIPVTTQSSDGIFYDENQITGAEGTIVDAAFMNNVQSAVRSVQSEIISILATAGMQPDQASVNQLMTALDGRFLKAPSAALTGVPTAPTASFGTTSTQIANMLAVHAAKASLSGVNSVTGSNTLTPAAAGSLVYMTGSTTFTTTLPAGDAVALGQTIQLVNYSTQPQTVATSGANIIYGGPVFGSLASMSLPPGAGINLVSRGSGEWDIIGGSGSTQYAAGLNFVSPVLSGTPTAPTAAQGTNNGQVATTAFTAAGLSQKLDISEVVGIPLPWPQATAPSGWLKCNGQAFDKALYPKLAIAYPAGSLPDLRGEFIRGWDDGRGVDSGRAIVSRQNATGLRTGAMDYNGSDVDSAGVYIGIGYADADSSTNTISFTNQGYPNGTLMAGGAGKDNGVSGNASSTVYSGGVNWITVRPRNISFNYIVRAA
ncbi:MULTISPECIES: phage tail protein [Dickeya]|uniref:Phage tail protein n=1 Tax=Dickeya oryzae TaxID=1240404 RepID=A0AB39IKZ4_9GAMM|nr:MULTISPECIES: phage tail protein [Dickeya]MCA6993532.1 phage tail protein [Dickeya oryzae]